MGKKGGGGGTPHITVPSGVSQNSQVDQTLGAYASSLLTPTLSLANWASSIATGGFGGQADYQNSKLLGSSYLANLENQNTYSNPFGLGGGGGTGAVGGGSAAGTAGASGPSYQLQRFPTYGGGGMQSGYAGTPNSAGDTPLYDQNTQQYIGEVHNGQFVPSTSPGASGFSAMYQGSGGSGSGGASPAAAGGGGGGGGGSQLGPFLQNAWDAIQAEGGAATQLGQEGTQIFNEGQGLLGMAENGSGLFPSQQAMVDQATKSQQAAIQQQMASEGLTSSTQNAQLQGQAAQQGAATAGQLVQGNISLAENWTQLGAATQQAAISALTTMAGQSAGLQSNMWTEAMQGYGMVGQFLNSALGAFGQSTQALSQYTQASETQQQLQFQAQASAASASNQGMSSMLGGLTSLFGGGGGGGGGLIGSLGGLFGGAGAAAGGAAAAAGAAGAVGGATGAAGIGISAAATAAGAAFCAGEEPALPNGRRAKWISARA